MGQKFVACGLVTAVDEAGFVINVFCANHNTQQVRGAHATHLVTSGAASFFALPLPLLHAHMPKQPTKTSYSCALFDSV